MSNILDFSVSAKNPSKVGGVGTAIKYFPRPVGGGASAPWPSLSSAAAWSVLYSSSPNSQTPQSPNTNISSASLNPNNVLWIPNNSFDGVPFEVYAAGTFGSDSGDPSGTVFIQLQAVTGTLQNPVFTNIASPNAFSPNFTTVQPWMLQVSLLGDSVTGILGCVLAYFFVPYSWLRVVAVILGVSCFYALCKREGHAEGYIDGYDAGHEAGIFKTLGIQPAEMQEMHTTATDMKIDEMVVERMDERKE